MNSTCKQIIFFVWLSTVANLVTTIAVGKLQVWIMFGSYVALAIVATYSQMTIADQFKSIESLRGRIDQ